MNLYSQLKPKSKAEPAVLDACCGSRMFWFDCHDSRAVFVDKRRETHTLPDVSSAGGSRELVINPDIVADFTSLPFPDNRFAVVIFDPPHFARNGKNGWMAKKYGTLEGDWREELRKGFAECFRVLKPEGTLIFKWNDDEVAVTEIMALTPERPLVGNRYGKHYKSHWLVYIKLCLLLCACVVSGCAPKPQIQMTTGHYSGGYPGHDCGLTNLSIPPRVTK